MSGGITIDFGGDPLFRLGNSGGGCGYGSMGGDLGFSSLFSIGDPMAGCCYDGFGSNAAMEMQMRTMEMEATLQGIMDSTPIYDPATGQLVFTGGSPGNQSTGNPFIDYLNMVAGGGFGSQTSRGLDGLRLSRRGSVNLGNPAISKREDSEERRQKFADKDFFYGLGYNESYKNSSQHYNYGAVLTDNQGRRFRGKYQMGNDALQEANFMDKDGNWNGEMAVKLGIKSESDFLNNQDSQEIAVRLYKRAQWKAIEAEGLASLLGKTINGIKITETALIGGTQLGGVRGTKRFLEGKGDTKDQNNTGISTFMYELQDSKLSEDDYNFIVKGQGELKIPSTMISYND